MSEAVLKIREQIEALSAEEREELFDYLFDSSEMMYQLGGPQSKWLTEEELTAELDRRTEEMESGKVKGVPYEEVMERIRKKYP